MLSGFVPPVALGQATVTAPVDVGPLITSAITLLGAVAAIAVGGFIGFMVVRKGLRWISVALR